MARPSSFNKSVIKKAKKYLNETKKIKAGRLIKAADLALALGINRTTLYDWKEKHPEFSDILDELNLKQESTLLDYGLTGKWNSNIVKLALGKHGYKEQHGMSGEGEGEPIKVDANITNTIDRIYGGADKGSA